MIDRNAQISFYGFGQKSRRSGFRPGFKQKKGAGLHLFLLKPGRMPSRNQWSN